MKGTQIHHGRLAFGVIALLKVGNSMIEGVNYLVVEDV